MYILSKLHYGKFGVSNLLLSKGIEEKAFGVVGTGRVKADYENVKKLAFDWLATKLWLKFCGIFARLNE